MNPLYVGLYFAVFGAIMAVVASVVKKRRCSNEKYQKMITDFYNQVNNMLEQGEKLEAYCGYSSCAAVTNRRLLYSQSPVYLAFHHTKGHGLLGCFLQTAEGFPPHQTGSITKTPENSV